MTTGVPPDPGLDDAVAKATALIMDLEDFCTEDGMRIREELAAAGVTVSWTPANQKVPGFAPGQLVEITNHNTAHAIIDDDGRYACDGRTAGRYGIGWELIQRRVRRDHGRATRMTWADTKDKAVKPWPAWPCQTCVARLG